MKPNWIVAKKQSNVLIDQLLLVRGIMPEDKNKFLNPDFNRDLLDPVKLHDAKKACKIIKQAIDNNQKIGIFADYDADGIPGAAILAKTIEILGGKYEVYIPSRTEGYGLNIKGIDELYKHGCKLLISVDLGITGKKEVDYAKEKGLVTIITDHHEIQPDKLPKSAEAIVHTGLSKDYKEFLCGAGVVYKIVKEMNNLYGKPTISQFKWLSDLACISTICDIVPLEGENRVIAKYGLIALSKTKNIGLKKMMEYAQISNDKIDTYTVGFQIGPRINAPGRLEHAQISFFLLTTSDDKKASEYAKKLNETNIRRQKSLEEALKESKKIIKKNQLDKEKIIIFEGKNWQSGIVGLIASKITDEYCRPSIVFSSSDGILRGSGRSIDEFDLVGNLAKVSKYLMAFGGHKKAAGVSIERKNWMDFYKRIVKIANKILKPEDLVKKIKIDSVVEVNDLTFANLDEIKKMEPFGLGNPKPVFIAKNVQIAHMKWVGKEEKHLSMQVKLENSLRTFKTILFNHDKNNCKLSAGSIVDIVFNMEENVWNGKRYLDLKLIDYDKVGLI